MGLGSTVVGESVDDEPEIDADVDLDAKVCDEDDNVADMVAIAAQSTTMAEARAA